MIKKRTAFTMLELIFVIVVMGILGSYGVEFLARAYNNFLYTKINSDLQARSAASVEFIVKRLEHRIKKSASYLIGTNRYYLTSLMPADNTAYVLEWVAADEDNFRGTTVSLWSGMIDLNSSTNTSLLSPGSDFDSVNTQIGILSNGDSGLNNAAIYFIDSKLSPTNPWGFDGEITDQTKNMHRIQTSGTGNILAPNAAAGNFSGIEISEYYKLSWTANAVALENYNTTTKMGDLYFYYDYQPWQGDSYTSGKKVLLAEDISAFRFRSAGSMIKIQVCAKSDLLKDEGGEYALCKEKTVF